MSEDWAILAVGVLAGIVIGVAGMSLVVGAERAQQFNRGLATAVACSPGTYLGESTGGMVYCIGGEGETWRVRP